MQHPSFREFPFFGYVCERTAFVDALQDASFARDYKTISEHINKALKDELADEVEVAKFANTARHGAIEDKTQTHEKEYFNLEMVTSVGYRVKSKRGIQFRKWANKILKDYLIKGYAVNERIRKEQSLYVEMHRHQYC